jgi:hypothetical protein
MSQQAYERINERPLPLGALADSGQHDAVTAINSDPGALQVDTSTITNYVLGKRLTWTMDGTAFGYTMTAADANVTGVAASIASQLAREPLYGGRYVATSLLGVVTLTARFPGVGWTLVSTGAWAADFTVANVTANATAVALPYSRLVVADGQVAGSGNMQGKLARATNLTARAVTLTPTAVKNTRYRAAVKVQADDGIERTYGAEYDGSSRAVLATGVVGNNNAITWMARDTGADGENVRVELLDPAANDQPLWISVANNIISVHLATGGGGAITSTATQVMAAIQLGQLLAAKASLRVGAGDAGIDFTSRLEGRDGNAITVVYTDPAANSQPLWIERDANNVINVHLATDDAGAIVTTAQQILDLIQEGGRDVPAQGILGTVAANNAIIFRSALQGETGRRVSVSLTDAAAFAIVAPAESGAGEIVVEVQYRGAGNGNLDKAPEIVAGVMADAAAQRFVSCEECPGSTGAGNVPAVVAQRLDTVSRVSDDVTDLVSVALVGAGTGTVVAAAVASLAGGIPGHAAGELVSVASTGASTGAGVMTAAVAAQLACAAPAVATINAALAAQLNAQLPTQSVLAAGAATLALTAELAGKDFEYEVGADNAAAVWAVTTDNDGEETDVNEAALGVALRSDSIETNSDTEPGYPANRAMSVLREGRVVVHTEAQIAVDHRVYVRLADTAVTGQPLGAFRDTPAVDCVALNRKRFRWVESYSATRSVLQVSVD